MLGNIIWRRGWDCTEKNSKPMSSETYDEPPMTMYAIMYSQRKAAPKAASRGGAAFYNYAA